MKTGKSKEELLSTLDELDSLTNMDSVLRPKQKIYIEAERSGGNICNWSLREDMAAYKDSYPFKKGLKKKELLKALDSLNTEKEFDTISCRVLCYGETDTALTWDGKIKSTWICIDPYFPFEMKDGKPDFETVFFEMDESDYKLAMETRIAIYIPETKVLYPLKAVSYESFGKLMDCSASFKPSDKESPLAEALLIANKISDSKQLKVIYRNTNRWIRPVIGAAGGRFHIFSQRWFLETVEHYVSTLTDNSFELKDWSVADQRTVVRYSFTIDDTDFVIRAVTSDIPGQAISVSLMAQEGKADLLLKRNSSYHYENFGQTDVKNLFEGFAAAMKRYACCYKELAEVDIRFETNMLNNVFRILGKKKSKNIHIEEGMYNALALYSLVTEETYCTLPPKQAKELATEYAKLFFAIYRKAYPSDIQMMGSSSEAPSTDFGVKKESVWKSVDSEISGELTINSDSDQFRITF